MMNQEQFKKATVQSEVGYLRRASVVEGNGPGWLSNRRKRRFFLKLLKKFHLGPIFYIE